MIQHSQKTKLIEILAGPLSKNFRAPPECIDFEVLKQMTRQLKGLVDKDLQGDVRELISEVGDVERQVGDAIYWLSVYHDALYELAKAVAEADYDRLRALKVEWDAADPNSWD